MRPWCVRAALSMSRRVPMLGGIASPLDGVAKNLQACSFSTQPVSNKLASVLVPLFEDCEGNIQVVLTQRSSKLRTHSGEVCLPGGKQDPSDSDEVATALREAQEELGINPTSVNIVGRLPSFLSKHLHSVTPVVGVIPADLAFRPNKSEVASVFTAPLRMFLEAGPSYYSRDAEWEAGFPYRLHYWRYRYAPGGQEYLIWGLTAGILIDVAEKAFGCKATFEVSPPGVPPYNFLHFDGTRLGYRAMNGSGTAAAAGGQQLLGSPGGAMLTRRRAAEAQMRMAATAAGAVGLQCQRPVHGEAAAVPEDGSSAAGVAAQEQEELQGLACAT